MIKCLSEWVSISCVPAWCTAWPSPSGCLLSEPHHQKPGSSCWVCGHRSDLGWCSGCRSPCWSPPPSCALSLTGSRINVHIKFSPRVTPSTAAPYVNSMLVVRCKCLSIHMVHTPTLSQWFRTHVSDKTRFETCQIWSEHVSDVFYSKTIRVSEFKVMIT